MRLFRLTLSDSQKYEINSCRGWKWNSKNSTRRQRNRVVGVDEGGDRTCVVCVPMMVKHINLMDYHCGAFDMTTIDYRECSCWAIFISGLASRR